jgi:hypothetical protein
MIKTLLVGSSEREGELVKMERSPKSAKTEEQFKSPASTADRDKEAFSALEPSREGGGEPDDGGTSGCDEWLGGS